MKFSEFEAFRTELLSTRSDVLDCAETNIYRSLSHWAVPPTLKLETTVHRCDLAAEWVSYFGFKPAMAANALISCGVRDSLARLFTHYATERAQLWLPEDNYPVYAELATSAKLNFRLFQTLPEPSWPVVESTAGHELLLVTNPLKPRARWLNDSDVATLLAWLAKNPARRLLLDVVYTFATHLDTATLKLFNTNQTILLHSTTKGWLHPRLFGVALVPAQDVAKLKSMFRADAPVQQNLARAREMLGAHATIPEFIATQLVTAKAQLRNALPVNAPALWESDAPGYFTPVTAHWKDLLDKHRVLGIPATAFGSTQEHITILSSLNFLP